MTPDDLKKEMDTARILIEQHKQEKQARHKQEEQKQKEFNESMNKLIKLVIVAALLGLAGWVVVAGASLYVRVYNAIVSGKQDLAQSIGNLNSHYQRRHALIDNFVSIVKETKGFERELVQVEKQLLIETAKAKASATRMDVNLPEAAKKRLETEGQIGYLLSHAMDKLMVMAQHYPTINDPKMVDRNKTFEALSLLREDLRAIENDIAAARQHVNAAARSFNASVTMFPGNLIAPGMGMKEAPYFETLQEEARQDAKIKF